MSLYRRDFLRALASGTGAILMGRHWYRKGTGLIVPEPLAPCTYQDLLRLERSVVFTSQWPTTLQWTDVPSAIWGRFPVYSDMKVIRRAPPA